MSRWMKKLHMYAGLLTFSALVVWGLTGIHGAFLPHPDAYQPPAVSATREVSLRAPGALV